MGVDQIKKDIIKIISEIKGERIVYIPDVKIPLNMDSIDFVRTLLEVEMEFDIEFSDEDLIISKYEYVDDIVKVVMRLVKNNEI